MQGELLRLNQNRFAKLHRALRFGIDRFPPVQSPRTFSSDGHHFPIA
jgi:hypothetical protein